MYAAERNCVTRGSASAVFSRTATRQRSATGDGRRRHAGARSHDRCSWNTRTTCCTSTAHRPGVVRLPFPVLPSVAALGPDAAQEIYTNRNKDYSQEGWKPDDRPVLQTGLMPLDFRGAPHHRRIMQEV